MQNESDQTRKLGLIAKVLGEIRDRLPPATPAFGVLSEGLGEAGEAERDWKLTNAALSMIAMDANCIKTLAQKRDHDPVSLAHYAENILANVRAALGGREGSMIGAGQVLAAWKSGVQDALNAVRFNDFGDLMPKSDVLKRVETLLLGAERKEGTNG